jgi:Icc-related predicted phosphoesterase
MIKITHISDTHGFHDKVYLSGGDILVHSGDIFDYNNLIPNEEIIEWINNSPYEYKLIVPGNHDKNLSTISLPEKVIVLDNKTTELFGIKFYGISACLIEKNSKNTFTQTTDNEIKNQLLDFYPDILITHGPPKGIFDNKNGGSIGSVSLLNYVIEKKPKYHFFGHAHHWKGVHSNGDTIFCNSSVTYNVRQGIVTGNSLDIFY